MTLTNKNNRFEILIILKMIRKNIQILRESIENKCKEIGRDPAEITLIAVSKFKPVEDILEAFNAGLTNFGENKAQELRDKAEKITENLTWHFIGHLQTNKVKYVIKAAEFIHSVDSLKLAKEIEKKAAAIGKVQKILLEINTSGEETKFGLRNKNEIYEIAEYCEKSENLDLRGLMTMAPFTDNRETIRESFLTLRKLKDEINGDGFKLEHLSMGMTNDYLIAIEEGATMLRIGTAIFGARNYT